MYNDMMDTIGLVEKADPELAAAMDRELTRQRENIELIASENIVSPAVMAAMGSVLTNKYADGHCHIRCIAFMQYGVQCIPYCIARMQCIPSCRIVVQHIWHCNSGCSCTVC